MKAPSSTQTRLAYYYAMPALAVMALVVLYPFLYNLVVSFSNMNLTHFRDWSLRGPDNYLTVVRDPIFWYYLGKTVLWTALNLVAHVGIGVFLALILNKNIKGKSVFRIMLILPWAVPQYITALTWRGMFNAEYGAVNLFLQQFGGVEFSWLSTEWGAFFACLITNIWLGFPFMMMIALGGLQSIPDALYEAADIDGATPWQKFRHITAPLLKPVMIPAIVLGVIWTFNNFNVVWLVSNGGEPADT
nr:sugar ABC transporter permease [Calditrichia bacterium]